MPFNSKSAASFLKDKESRLSKADSAAIVLSLILMFVTSRTSKMSYELLDWSFLAGLPFFETMSQLVQCSVQDGPAALAYLADIEKS